MPSSTTTGTRTTSSQDRTRRGNRGRGRGGHANKAARRSGDARPAPPSVGEAAPNPSPTENLAVGARINIANEITTGATQSDDASVCWICAEPVQYYSVSSCNHRTCHVCALRLRALYKKLECTFCKEPQSTVICTASPDAAFASYTPDAIPYKDSKLAIFFETQDMMEETLILLRFNCPDDECDYTASGWGDLKLHTRAMHGKMLCDLCIRSKKVFAHEHAMYPPNVLPLHLPSIPHRPIKQPLKDPIEGGVHPLCAFCSECFFGDDELFVHMRERHEECFLCKRNEIRDQYFQNYESLEAHFYRAHFACTNSVCQMQKFVVFDSELDLKAHQVEVHGADMSSKDRKDARRVVAEFEFNDAGVSSRRGRRDQERERDPPPQTVQAQARAGGRRREAFGGHLTTEGASTTPPAVPSGRASPARDDVDPLVAERHASFISRLQSIAPHPTNAVAAVKAAIRGYRANESSARDLISTVWNVLDHILDDTASIINGVVDLLEEEEKKRDLLAAWNGFKIEQRQQFPDLVPTAVGSGYVGIASGRVFNAKHATATRSSQQSSRQVWDRVAQAASASSSASRNVPGAGTPRPSSAASSAGRFPPLAGPSSGVGFRQPQRQTPWASGSTGASGSTSANAAAPSGPSPAATTISPKKKAKPPPALSASAFPELPATQSKIQKPAVSGNVSLRHILGDVAPSSAWRPNESGTNTGADVEARTQASQEHVDTGSKGKKGKGKQKQTLFTFGSIPT